MKRFDKILLVVDANAPCPSLVERAVALAESHQAALSIAVVVPRFVLAAGLPEDGPVTLELQAALLAEQEQALEALAAPLRDRLAVRTTVLSGTAFLEIVREVLRHGHDLVIRAAENPGWLERLLGSDDMHLLRKCPCPVWLVKCEAPKGYRRILAAVDADDGYPAEELETRRAMNREILELAASLALSEFAELHVASVWEAVGASLLRGPLVNTAEERIAAYVAHARSRNAARLQELVRGLDDVLGKESAAYLAPATHLVRGRAREEIPALAKRLGVDLVVMGTVARTGIPGFIMGNTAEAILDQLGCSVLAIKPPGFVTPVAPPR